MNTPHRIAFIMRRNIPVTVNSTDAEKQVFKVRLSRCLEIRKSRDHDEEITISYRINHEIMQENRRQNHTAMQEKQQRNQNVISHQHAGESATKNNFLIIEQFAGETATKSLCGTLPYSIARTCRKIGDESS